MKMIKNIGNHNSRKPVPPNVSNITPINTGIIEPISNSGMTGTRPSIYNNKPIIKNKAPNRLLCWAGNGKILSLAR